MSADRIVVRKSTCRRCGWEIDLVGMKTSGRVADRAKNEEPTSWMWTLPNGSAYCEEDGPPYNEHIPPEPLDLSDPELLDEWLAS